MLHLTEELEQLLGHRVDVVSTGGLKDRERHTWDTDRISQFAVERLFEIIGESARAMSGEARSALPAVPWADVIGLRVVLAHH